MVSTDADAEAELARINNLTLSFLYHDFRRSLLPAEAMRTAKGKLGFN